MTVEQMAIAIEGYPYRVSSLAGLFISSFDRPLA